MTARVDVNQPRGVWLNPVTRWVGSLGPIGTIFAVLGVMAGLYAMSLPDRLTSVFWVSVVFGPIIAGFAIRDEVGAHVYTRLFYAQRWARHRATGASLWMPSWFSVEKVEASQLPGLLSRTTFAVQPTTDGEGTFVVIHHPSANTVQVVIEVDCPGLEMLTVDEIVTRRQDMADWLASTNRQEGLSSVVIGGEAALAASAEVEGLLKAARGEGEVTDFVVDTMTDLAAIKPGVVNRTWVTLAWSPEGADVRKRFSANSLPALVERACTELMTVTGGPARPVTKDELNRTWAGMYSPERRAVLATGPAPTAGNVAPSGHKESPDRYQLGAYDSIAVSMGGIPPGEIATTAITDLSSGIDGAVAVRWCEIFHPVTPTEANRWVSKATESIETRMSLRGDRKQKITDQVEQEDTTSTAKSLARGMSVVKFGFIACATVPVGMDTETVVQRLLNGCASLQAHVRVENWNHQAMWVASLPGGPVLSDVVKQGEVLAGG